MVSLPAPLLLAHGAKAASIPSLEALTTPCGTNGGLQVKAGAIGRTLVAVLLVLLPHAPGVITELTRLLKALTTQCGTSGGMETHGATGKISVEVLLALPVSAHHTQAAFKHLFEEPTTPCITSSLTVTGTSGKTWVAFFSAPLVLVASQKTDTCIHSTAVLTEHPTVRAGKGAGKTGTD